MSKQEEIVLEKAAPKLAPSYRFEEERKADSKKVKGIFQYHELHGGTLSFCFKKWKGDTLQHYTLVDGQEYELPLGVVRHLNSDCSTEEHSYLLGPDGKHIKTGRKIPRFSFKSREYL